jgi:methyltransferase
MGVSVKAFLGLLGVVALLRVAELRISRRNQRAMTAQGVGKIREAYFPWMVLVHAGVLGGAALEVILLRRPFLPLLAGVMSLLFLLANVLRLWVVRTLKVHWNVQVMDSARLGVVTAGPYRYIRHPNYLAVFTELLALPLIHTAWITALAGSAANAAVLAQRLATEERMLLSNPEYRTAMAHKPRFLPGLF